MLCSDKACHTCDTVHVMNTTQSKHVSVLIQERQALSKQLEALDKEIFGRFQALEAALFGGTAPIPPAPRSDFRAPALPPPSPQKALWRIGAPPNTMAAAIAQSIRRKTEIGASLEDAALSALAAAGRPLRTRDLLEKVREAGVEVPGKDPANNLSAHLSRSARVRSTSLGWVISEE